MATDLQTQLKARPVFRASWIID